jgi:hypothetical protein
MVGYVITFIKDGDELLAAKLLFNEHLKFVVPHPGKLSVSKEAKPEQQELLLSTRNNTLVTNPIEVIGMVLADENDINETINC